MSIGWEQQDIKVVKAHGENIPLNKNLSPEERSLNRRVEIKIINASDNKGKSLTEKLADPTLTTGTNIVLRNINFVGGMHQFLPESKPMLDELLELHTEEQYNEYIKNDLTKHIQQTIKSLILHENK